MSQPRFEIGTDIFICENTGKKCSIKVCISRQTDNGCDCYVVVQNSEKAFEETIVGENWYQAVILAAEFIRRHLAENYAGYRRDDGEGTTSSVHYIYPRFVDPYYGTDVYDDICNYMDKKIQAIEDDRTRRFGTQEDDRNED